MKLEDINKDNIFRVPNRYFDELPGRIQARIPQKEVRSRPVFTWKLATAVLVPAMIVLFFLVYTGSLDDKTRFDDPEVMIAQVSTEDVISYLELTDISAEEILEQVAYGEFDLSIDEDIPLLWEELDIDEEGYDAIMDHYDLNEKTLDEI